MPGFIGVRWGELVPVTPDDKSPDVYFYGDGHFGIITVEGELVERELPGGGPDIVWSHGGVKSVRSTSFVDPTTHIFTSQDGAKSWTDTIGDQPNIRYAMLFDELYALDADNTTIRVSRTQGTTWFDVGDAPSGTSISSDIKGSDEWIYGNVTPQE